MENTIPRLITTGAAKAKHAGQTVGQEISHTARQAGDTVSHLGRGAKLKIAGAVAVATPLLAQVSGLASEAASKAATNPAAGNIEAAVMAVIFIGLFAIGLKHLKHIHDVDKEWNSAFKPHIPNIDED